VNEPVREKAMVLTVSCERKNTVRHTSRKRSQQEEGKRTVNVFQVPSTPVTTACPPSFPIEPTSRETLVTSLEKRRSLKTCGRKREEGEGREGQNASLTVVGWEKATNHLVDGFCGE
jgi:hypothetical protein